MGTMYYKQIYKVFCLSCFSMSALFNYKTEQKLNMNSQMKNTNKKCLYETHKTIFLYEKEKHNKQENKIKH